MWAVSVFTVTFISSGKADEKADLTRDKKLAQFNNWFTWCHNCRHGGHAGHMLSWFRYASPYSFTYLIFTMAAQNISILQWFAITLSFIIVSVIILVYQINRYIITKHKPSIQLWLNVMSNFGQLTSSLLFIYYIKDALKCLNTCYKLKLCVYNNLRRLTVNYTQHMWKVY